MEVTYVERSRIPLNFWKPVKHWGHSWRLGWRPYRGRVKRVTGRNLSNIGETFLISVLSPFAPLSFWVKVRKNESMHLCNKMYPDISEQTTRLEHIELKSECWVYFQVKKNNWDWPINQTMDPCSHSDACANVQQLYKSIASLIIYRDYIGIGWIIFPTRARGHRWRKQSTRCRGSAQERPGRHRLALQVFHFWKKEILGIL